MCGIAGVFEYEGRGVVSEAQIARMRDTLEHRGPDAEGAFVSGDGRVGLGIRRLAIVDPAGGDQPMVGGRGECLVFNGEIYNYPALRKQLEGQGVAFNTTCDTEVVLRLYERHGADCVEHLDGMFAFAVWDPARERLLMARDRIGEKPLYWSASGGRLLFGSEIKALLAHESCSASVNEAALPAYLTNLVTSGPETLYAGISKLPPGTLAICDADGVRMRRYWDLFAPRTWRQDPLDDAAATVRSKLSDSVRSRLMSDVPVGVLLSGGLDSTTITALLHESGRKTSTFSVGYDRHPELDERAEARRVAAHFGTEHHEISVSQQDALGFLGRMVHHQDEPLGDPVCIPLNFVCELARRHGVKVVLAGEGADELFWGYPRYAQVLGRWRQIELMLRLPSVLRRGLNVVGRAQRRPWLQDLLAGIATGRPLPLHLPLAATQREREQILKGPAGALTEGFAPSANGASGPRDTLAFDTQEYEFGLRLPELLLMRIDRFSMANGVEARVPFLAPDLVDYAYRLPLDYKLRGDDAKIVLKRAISDIVPRWVLERPKQGFGAPVVEWLGSDLGDVFDQLADADTLRAYFDVDALRDALGVGTGGPGSASFALWPVVNFGLWHRYWIEGESLEPLVGDLGSAP